MTTYLIRFSFLLALLFPFVVNADAMPEQTINKNDWTHYYNHHYQFSIQYPKNLQAERTFQGHYLINNFWRYDPSATKNTGTVVFNLPVFQKTTNGGPYFAAEIRIGISTNGQDFENCYNGADSTKDIPSGTVQVMTVNDTAMSQFLRLTSYRIKHKNQCFAIEQIITANNSKENNVLADRYAPLLTAIADTFTFIH